MLSRIFLLLMTSIMCFHSSHALSINRVIAGFLGGGLCTTLASIMSNMHTKNGEQCTLIAPVGLGITWAGVIRGLARCAGYGRPCFPARELKFMTRFYEKMHERIDNRSYARANIVLRWYQYAQQNQKVHAFFPTALDPRRQAAARLESARESVQEQLVYLPGITQEFRRRNNEADEAKCKELGIRMVQLNVEINERLKEYEQKEQQDR